MESYRISADEAKYLAVAVLTVAAGFAGYKQLTDPVPILSWLGIAALVIAVREFGQRTIAEWMDAYVEVELSTEGSSMTIVAAMIAYLLQMPIVALFPLASSFSGKSYEHWGRTIDAIWMKRQFWIVLGGLIALLLSWMVTLQLGFARVAEGFIVFTLFQLMPFDYKDIPTGTLDGAYILRWSGFVWLTLMGITVVGVVVTV